MKTFVELAFNFVYYIFDGNKYYRVNQDFKVISTGSYKYTEKSVFELEEDNQKYYWKISLSSEVVDQKVLYLWLLLIVSIISAPTKIV